MNPFFIFETKRIIKRWPAYLVALVLTMFGIFCGHQFNLTVGDGIYLNSPYTIGFMTGMLSLSILFFAIVYASQILFKDQDSRFDILLFSYPITKKSYLKGLFFLFFLQTLFSFILMMIGFIIGQNLRSGSEMQAHFTLLYYLYPILIFGFINALLVCSLLFFLAITTKKKLLVVVGGLFLYVLYMVVLVFSGSPLMSGSSPQSSQTQQISALLDPFGLSSYFFEGRKLSAIQKNDNLVGFSGYLLINRLVTVAISFGLLLWSYRFFSLHLISPSEKRMKSIVKKHSPSIHYSLAQNEGLSHKFVFFTEIRTVLSFAKIDLIYLFKNIAITAVSILILFFIGMEMYAEIEKGIRIPQKYASSGLMSVAISENFFLFGLLIAVYFVNDLYWRSQLSGFSLIEKSTYFSKSKLVGHFLSVSVLLFFLNLILIGEGIVFQFIYGYIDIDWSAYSGTIFFNTLPLILFSALALLLNNRIKNRYSALGICLFVALAVATPVSKKIIPYPLFRIFSDYKGVYSDFVGYGVYTFAFAERLLFGIGLISFLWLVNNRIETGKFKIKSVWIPLILISSGMTSAYIFVKDYQPENKETQLIQSAHYEKYYKKFENEPQPTVKEIKTLIQLNPSEHSYTIKGTYTIVNLTPKEIDRVLINFYPNLPLKSAIYSVLNENYKINQNVTVINLKKSLKSGESSRLNFEISYKWLAVNGHDSFNAIIENGSFMRISRYFPTIGYQKDFEMKDEEQRNEFKLGKIQPVKKFDAPPVYRDDFINLDMTISTSKDQTVIGTGDLTDHYKKNNRNYFRYKASNIPFRFAVASADYQVKYIQHKGITLNIYYNKNHPENVDHLLKNAVLTLDYCTENFGEYPFKSINFAEISSFTKGFAATAYPSAIFMTEDMLFHADIRKDKNQDVINELAGHELSHVWWGNSQIDPDDREGSAMLTETLAMYTEMMIFKKMYGKQKMMERLKVHQQIYDEEKSLSGDQSLMKVESENTHISYSKGAVAMVKLSNLIGEAQVNKALRNFLIHNKYPKKPTSNDLLIEFYKVCPDTNSRKKMDQLFRT